MSEFSVILVKSTTQAMRIEHILTMGGISSKLIPVPRYLSSNCGNCVRILTRDVDSSCKLLEKNLIQIERIVELDH